MLLAAGCSHIQIMRRTGLSRRTISRIAKEGRRKLVAADISDDRPAGFDQECLNRCRGCGARIYLWPCLVCEVRSKVEAREEVRKASGGRKPPDTKTQINRHLEQEKS
jgi:hypothetical protein